MEAGVEAAALVHAEGDGDMIKISARLRQNDTNAYLKARSCGYGVLESV